VKHDNRPARPCAGEGRKVKWYAEQIDALRAENEQLRLQIVDLEIERDQLQYRIDGLIDDLRERTCDE